MTKQLELTLHKAPSTTPEEVERFVSLLFENGGWMTAEMVGALTTWSDRKCRALAARSAGRISSGQEGYKHTKHMTNEEYNHFRNGMKSQAEKMTARILASDKVFYSRQSI